MRRRAKEGVEWEGALSYGGRAVLGYLYMVPRVPSYDIADGAGLPTVPGQVWRASPSLCGTVPFSGNCARYLEISIDDVSAVHMFESEDDLGTVEPHLCLGEHAVLRQMVVQVAAVHQVQDEAQLLGSLKSVRHAHDERTAFLLKIYQTTTDDKWQLFPNLLPFNNFVLLFTSIPMLCCIYRIQLRCFISDNYKCRYYLVNKNNNNNNNKWL